MTNQMDNEAVRDSQSRKSLLPESEMSVGEPKIFGWKYSLDEGALKALGHQGKSCQSYGNMGAYRNPQGGKKGI